MLKKLGIALAGLMTAGMLTMGCDHVENAIDCHGICKRYSDCYDKTYDVDKCTNNCEANANKDSSYMTKADDCNNCMDDKSCASLTFNCATQCAGIID